MRMTFDGPQVIELWDDGQSCCERRYMRTDDDLQSLVGHKLTRVEEKPCGDLPDEEGDSHECVFVEVATDSGFVTIANHNEHNGYYGGFCIEVSEVTTN